MARNRDIFNMVQNVPGRNEVSRKRKPSPAGGSRDGMWDLIGGPYPTNVASYNEPVAYQTPGTSGMGDVGMGYLYETNPEYFGSETGQWSQMEDIGQSMWQWQQYLDAMAGGVDLQDLLGDDLTPEYWAQQEAGYDWWNTYGPGNTPTFGDWVTNEGDMPWNSGFTNVFYPEGPMDWSIGDPSQGMGVTPGPQEYGAYGLTHPQLGAGTPVHSGFGAQGGSGDLGTGSAFAGGSMYGTMTGGGLWDYDCATQGPLYNTQGECIACCG